jgi:hypothetical protein
MLKHRMWGVLHPDIGVSHGHLLTPMELEVVVAMRRRTRPPQHNGLVLAGHNDKGSDTRAKIALHSGVCEGT